MKKIIILLLVFTAQLQAEDINVLEKLCNGDNGGKCTELGLARIQSMNGSSDNFNSKSMSNIISLFKKACEANDMKGCSLLGLIYLKQGQKSKGIKILDKACDKNYGIACAELSTQYNDENYVKQDIIKSQFYLTKACDLGETESCEEKELLTIKKSKKLSINNIKAIEALLLNNKNLLPKTYPDFEYLKYIISNKNLFEKIGSTYKAKTVFKIYGHKLLYLNLVGVTKIILGPNATVVGSPKDVAMSIQKKYNIKFELEKHSGDYYKELGNNLVTLITHHRKIENASLIILTTLDDPYH